MPVSPSFTGRTYTSSEPYLVGREKLREFARAVGATHPACHDVAAARTLGYPDLVAPPTFAVVVAQQAESAYVDDPAAGIDFDRVVHGQEAFSHHRPIVAGDRLTSHLTVKAVTVRAGLSLVTTQVDLTDHAGQLVCRVTSQLAVRGGDAQ